MGVGVSSVELCDALASLDAARNEIDQVEEMAERFWAEGLSWDATSREVREAVVGLADGWDQWRDAAGRAEFLLGEIAADLLDEQPVPDELAQYDDQIPKAAVRR